MKVFYGQMSEITDQTWTMIMGASIWLSIIQYAEAFMFSKIVVIVTGLWVLNSILGTLAALHASVSGDTSESFSWNKATLGVIKWVAWMSALLMTYGIRVWLSDHPAACGASIALDTVDFAIALTIAGSVVRNIAKIVKIDWFTRLAEWFQRAPEKLMETGMDRLENIVGESQKEGNNNE